MPTRLSTPVLTVDVNLIRKVDTRNVENLYSMWTVFSRCAGSLEEGRRLENLSWRIWNRETFCCDSTHTATAATAPTRIPPSRASSEVPALSGSVDSIVDDDAIEDFAQKPTSTSAPLDIARPVIQRVDSTSSQGRGRERHITPDDLEKMVINIKEHKELEPLPPMTHRYLATSTSVAEALREEPVEPVEPLRSVATTTPSTLVSEPVSANSSMTAVSSTSSSSTVSDRSTTSIVRGFSPSHISSSYRKVPLVKEPTPLSSSVLAAIPETTAAVVPPAKKTVFALGGSSQSDNESFHQSPMEMAPLKKKATQFSLGASSNEDESVMSARPETRSSLTEGLRQSNTRPSIKEVAAQDDSAASGDVFESDDEDVDESAIDDDDDDSGWEDSPEDSGKSSIDEKTFFQRVDSRPALTSRRSLITTMLHQSERANAMANLASGLQRSRTATPNGPSLAASPESDDGMPLMMKPTTKSVPEIPRSAAQPISVAAPVNLHQSALSPKTTRRNMLNSELTQSLRRHMLWERQYLNAASAALPRRHTSHDVANLRQYPEQAALGPDDKDTYGSYNQYFRLNLGGYHSKGW